MKKWIKNALYFLRLTDDEGLLSITHIACIIVMVKVALATDPSIVDMGSLLITLALYYGKGHRKAKATKISDANQQAIDEMKIKVQQIQDKTAGMAAQLGFRNITK